MAKEENQQAYILIGMYQQLWKNKYNKIAVINRYKRKWDMLDVIQTIGYDRAKEVLEYYFDCNKPGHSMEWFLSNFDKLDLMLRKSKEDKAHRDYVKGKTKELVEQDELEHRSIRNSSGL
jgi:hypothetical protein